MDVANPRRILAVSLAESQDHLSTVIKGVHRCLSWKQEESSWLYTDWPCLDLTGAYPEPSAGTGALAGTTQELVLATPYYSARVPVWLDLIGAEEQPESAEDVVAVGEPAKASEEEESPVQGEDGTADSVSAGAAAAASPTMTPRQWADAFLTEEAREVRAALGGVVVVLDIGGGDEGSDSGGSPANRVEQQRDLVSHVGRLIREGLGAAADDGNGGEDALDYYDDSWDGVGLVVGIAPRGTGPPPAEDVLADWEDACMAAGLEFVLVAPGQAATNEFGGMFL